MKIKKKLIAFILVTAIVMCGACTSDKTSGSKTEDTSASVNSTDSGTSVSTPEPASPDAGRDVVILFTSDVHCGVDTDFGYAGLASVRKALEEEGNVTLLVDDGDAVQGEPIGTMTKGEAIIRLMNLLKYDVAIPGNHEFDYGMDRFNELCSMAEYPYISCNFNKQGELVFKPYIIKEAGDFKIGFVGVTTPYTLKSSTPKYFQNEKGEFIYGFMQDADGKQVFDAVQKAVDGARAEGADFVVVMGHIGNVSEGSPYTYADIIENTTGIDVFLDGHSHDTDCVSMKDKAGNTVLRSACGTKFNSIGWVKISAESKKIESGLYTWGSEQTVPGAFALDEEVKQAVEKETGILDEKLAEVVAHTSVELTINDPVQKDESGAPIRIVRRAETNLGDLCADAYKDQLGAEIAFCNGGGVRVSIPEGDITLNDIFKVHPFGNALCMVNASGKTILDALEWSVKKTPSESGGFLQVSGITFDIDLDAETNCVSDENGMFVKTEGEGRVKNVKVNGEPLDPERIYTVASSNYVLKNSGDGYTMFKDSELLLDEVMLDYQALINYITDTLDGVVGEEYSDPYGNERIRAIVR